MRTTKADLEAQIKMLRWNIKKGSKETESLKEKNNNLRECINGLQLQIKTLNMLPEALHGATEALAHMLADARQIYMQRR